MEVENEEVAVAVAVDGLEERLLLGDDATDKAGGGVQLDGLEGREGGDASAALTGRASPTQPEPKRRRRGGDRAKGRPDVPLLSIAPLWSVGNSQNAAHESQDLEGIKKKKKKKRARTYTARWALLFGSAR